MEPLPDGLQIRFLLYPTLQKSFLPITGIKPPESFPLAIGEREIAHSFGVDGLGHPFDIDAESTRSESDQDQLL